MRLSDSVFVERKSKAMEEHQSCCIEQGKHESTRSTLKELDTWIRDTLTGPIPKHCWWITSIAGAGKTATLALKQYIYFLPSGELRRELVGGYPADLKTRKHIMCDEWQ
jgi:hypothetical protein